MRRLIMSRLIWIYAVSKFSNFRFWQFDLCIFRILTKQWHFTTALLLFMALGQTGELWGLMKHSFDRAFVKWDIWLLAICLSPETRNLIPLDKCLPFTNSMRHYHDPLHTFVKVWHCLYMLLRYNVYLYSVLWIEIKVQVKILRIFVKNSAS